MHRKIKPAKLNLLIDTNSLNHLSTLEFNRRKLVKLVFESFNVYICKTIYDEFCRGINKAKNQDNKATRNLLKKNEKKILLPETKTTKRIEEAFYKLEYYGSRSEKNKGERFMVSTALEMVYLDKFSQSILLTDDQDAIDKFLRNVNEDFHFGNIWKTSDLIFFLYFKSQINYVEAKEAIRELVSNTSTSIKEYRHYKNTVLEEGDARQRLAAICLERLEKIKRMCFFLTGGKE
jgi:rRNA-processing protein FCF1